MHDSGRRIQNSSKGIRIQIEKEQEVDENLDIYLCIIQDAQVNFEDGRVSEIQYSVSKVSTFSHNMRPDELWKKRICPRFTGKRI